MLRTGKEIKLLYVYKLMQIKRDMLTFLNVFKSRPDL